MDYLSDYQKAIRSERKWSDAERKKEFDDIVQSMRSEIDVSLPLFNDHSAESESEAKDAIFHTHRKECEKALELWKKYSKPA